MKEERANRMLCRYDSLNFYMEAMLHIPLFDIYVFNVDDNRSEATLHEDAMGTSVGRIIGDNLCWILFTI